MDNLNQANTLIFHPGIGKTATSKIQELGLNLPTSQSDRACFSPYGLHGGAHNLISSVHPDFTRQQFNDHWPKLLAFASEYQGATVVSSEFLIRDKPQHIRYLIESAKEKGLNVKVMVAIRDYSEYLMSSYLQAIKVNWGIRANEGFLDFSKRELEHIRYPQLVNRWSTHCGDDNVYILDYSQNKQGFVKDFFALLGISIDDNSKVSDRVNLSIPFEIAPIIRHFDRISDNTQLRKSLIELLSSHEFKAGFKNNNLKQLDQHVVINKYAHDVERLKARYQWAW